jgi:hypothetical protein
VPGPDLGRGIGPGSVPTSDPDLVAGELFIIFAIPIFQHTIANLIYLIANIQKITAPLARKEVKIKLKTGPMKPG